VFFDPDGRFTVPVLLIGVTRGKLLAEATLISLPRPLTGETEGTTYVGPAVPKGQRSRISSSTAR